MPTFLLLAFLLGGTADLEHSAALALREFDTACAEEGGRLWGASLCGPLVVVDPESRLAAANQPDPERRFERRGEIYVGRLADDVGLANTAFDWSGSRWSMVLAPLPDAPAVRRTLLLHEAWHRLQPRLGFSGAMVANDHLAERSGRTWLRLEWTALAAALRSAGAERRQAAADALLFRRHRYALHPQALEQETLLELNEGLAQYTGVRLGRGAEAASATAAALDRAQQGAAMARSFAYATGPAWGLLLDELLPDWRERLDPATNFGELAAAGLAVDWGDAPRPESVAARAAARGLRQIDAEEERIAASAREERERLLRTLVEAPGLVLPLAQMQMQFDPRTVTPLPPHGTVYRVITIQDRWGEIVVEGGGLLSSDFTRLALPGEPEIGDGRALRGDGWRLTLAEGWELAPPSEAPRSVRPVE